MTILTIIIAILIVIIVSANLLLTYVLNAIHELLSLSVLVLKTWEKDNDKI
jgi:hypothetical protein